MVYSFQHFIKQFDLFSKPFTFFIGNKKEKSTLIGGILSFSILIIAAAYFYYLLNMYFGNKIEPKISSNSKLESSLMSVNIADNFFIFEMMIKGMPLKKYEKKVGKKYLNYKVSYAQYFKNGTYSSQNISIIECTDVNFFGYLCMNDNDIQNKKIIRNSKEVIISLFILQIEFCDPSVELNCANENEVMSVILKSSNHLSVLTKIEQFNSVTKQYDIAYKEEYYNFDPDLFLFSSINLTKATTKVTQGLIIQQSESTDTIYDYIRKDTVFSNNQIKKRLDITGFGVIVFELSQVSKDIVFQFPMITEIFAQFMSIFNFLLTIGIIARMHAETRIVEEMNNILLKKYYKKTAARLLKKNEDKIKDQEQEQIECNKEQSIQNQTPNKISELFKKINQTNFFFKNEQGLKIKIINQIKKCFQFLFKRNKPDNQKNDPESEIFQELLKLSLKRINIFEIYNDLIQLKMAIKLILTKEQFAAMQFCGSEIFIGDNKNMNQMAQQNNQIQQSIKKEKKNEKHLNDLVINNNNLEMNSSYCNSKVEIFKENIFFKSLSQVKLNQISNNTPLPIKEEAFFDEQTNQGIESNILKNTQNQQEFQNSNNIKDHSFLNINVKHCIFESLNSSINKKKLIKPSGDRENALHDSQIIDSLAQSSKLINDYCDSSAETQKQLRTYSHLQLMDQIEDNQEMQEKFLHNFYKSMLNNSSKEVNQIDRQIFLSLLIQQNDEQLN